MLSLNSQFFNNDFKFLYINLNYKENPLPAHEYEYYSFIRRKIYLGTTYFLLRI